MSFDELPASAAACAIFADGVGNDYPADKLVDVETFLAKGI
jgi:hypothetical protein